MSSSNHDRDVPPTSAPLHVGHVAAPRQRIQSGHYAVDLSNTHDDESTARAPWDDLVHCPSGAAEIRVPGRQPVVRALPLGSMDEAVTMALGQWFGDETLRHWFAFRKLPVEQGRVTWRLEAHLGVLGEEVSEESRERATVEIDRLTSISLMIWTPRRDLRLLAPLFVPIARTERAIGALWVLRDMIVRVHPLLIPEDEGPPTEPSEPSEDTLNERHQRTLGR
jgi:hypothetical protein